MSNIVYNSHYRSGRTKLTFKEKAYEEFEFRSVNVRYGANVNPTLEIPYHTPIAHTSGFDSGHW